VCELLLLLLLQGLHTFSIPQQLAGGARQLGGGGRGPGGGPAYPRGRRPSTPGGAGPAAVGCGAASCPAPDLPRIMLWYDFVAGYFI